MSGAARQATAQGALCAALALLGAAGCRDNAGPPLRIVAGAGPEDDVLLVPKASLAEYVEVSPQESALLITLSSDARACEQREPAPRDASSLSVRVVLPGGAKLVPGDYPILVAPAEAATPHALPTARLRGRRVEFPPGGSLALKQVDLSPRGSISGLFKFEFAGSAERPATRISGPFSAHFCRINRLGDD